MPWKITNKCCPSFPNSPPCQHYASTVFQMVRNVVLVMGATITMKRHRLLSTSLRHWSYWELNQQILVWLLSIKLRQWRSVCCFRKESKTCTIIGIWSIKQYMNESQNTNINNITLRILHFRIFIIIIFKSIFVYHFLKIFDLFIPCMMVSDYYTEILKLSMS